MQLVHAWNQVRSAFSEESVVAINPEENTYRKADLFPIWLLN